METSVDVETAGPFLDEVGQDAATRWSWPLRIGLLGGLLAAMAVVAIVSAISTQQKSANPSPPELIAFRGLHPTVTQTLAARYEDTNGDLLADPPAADAALLHPTTLVLSHYTGDEEGLPRVDWKGLQRSLSQATGVPVKVQAYLNTEQEISAVAAGEIHLVAAHSAEIPCLVNTAGLIPFAELSTPEAIDGNRLVFAVPPDSPHRTLADLRGGVLVCTAPDSITGYRAAIVATYLETTMQPDVDYQVYFSHKHERSVRGLAIGKFSFIALSNDVLERMLRENRIKESQIRIIYESQVIPRLAIGHVHQLAPDLVEHVRQAVLGFDNKDVEAPPPGDRFRFVPTDYRKDYAFIRRLDDSFEPRFGQIFQSDASGF